MEGIFVQNMGQGIGEQFLVKDSEKKGLKCCFIAQESLKADSYITYLKK